ncbi:hypothetical protein ACTFIR_003351 [Dictyostelium discoideum]
MGGASDKKYKSNQFRAMFFKNATFIKRQKCSLCVQISIPLILVIILVIVNFWVKSQIGSLQTNGGKLMNSTSTYEYNELTYGYMLSVNENNITEIGYKDSDGSGSGLLNYTHQLYIPAFRVYTPFFVPFASVENMDDKILAMKENATFESLSSETLPLSALIFNDFNVNNRSLDYTIQCEEQSRYSFYPYEAFVAFSMNTMTTAILNYFLAGNGTIYKSNIATLPYYQQSTTIDIASLLGGSFYPFALSFIMPLFIYSIVYEKQEKLRDLSLMMGLKIRNYWFMTYIFNFLIYFIIIVFVVGVSSIFGFAVFVKGSQFAMFLFLFAWGNSMITFSFFLSTFFKKTRAASIFGYFLVIIAVNLNSILSYQVFKDSTPPVPYYWIPLLAFYRGMSQLSTQCGIDLCPEWSAYTWEFEMSKIIFWLYIDAIVYLLIALYLDQVLPREFGVPSHPLFFLKPILNLFKNKDNDKSNTINGGGAGGRRFSETSSLINSADFDVENSNGEQEIVEDEDVLEEKEMIINRRYDPNEMTVIIEGLTKHYAGRPKPSVDNLYLSVRKGEVLGFLGANGAGKTTTISMLTGLYTPTSGTAHVAGLDIRYDMDNIHHVIGVAMQFDIFWEDLSCVETLLYFTRLKGVPPEREIQSVESILKEVNLFEVKERLVKELSGGMKRRLSFAVAMTGDSSIIFLDEPSTGISSELRRDLWRTINDLKKNRSIILTTHSMEEADVLSSRIAIISQGKLQCIGTQNHLKAKFGDGYSVRINVEEPYINTHNPTELITKFSPQAVLTESFDGSYNYRFPKNTVISDLYQYLVSHKYDHHLQEWSFSQTSLEDVFLKISANDDTIN